MRTVGFWRAHCLSGPPAELFEGSTVENEQVEDEIQYNRFTTTTVLIDQDHRGWAWGAKGGAAIVLRYGTSNSSAIDSLTAPNTTLHLRIKCGSTVSQRISGFSATLAMMRPRLALSPLSLLRRRRRQSAVRDIVEIETMDFR